MREWRKGKEFIAVLPVINSNNYCLVVEEWLFKYSFEILGALALNYLLIPVALTLIDCQ